jgi:rare lipoprotein A
MAVVVASVVIFLLGVLVGRGVRAESGPTQALVQPTSTAISDVAPAPAPGGAPASAAKEELSYPNRLASTNPPPETLPTPRADTAQEPAPPAPAASTSARGESKTGGFAIQVAALRQRAEAESVARGLTTKGYPAYVMNPDAGAPAVFRVRVGKFKDRREAESVAARLQKEEQFKPWIVR